MKKLLSLFAGLIVVNSYADDVSVSTKLTKINNCRVNHTCDQQATHDIQIINDTNQNHLYYYSYSVCMVGSGHCEIVQNQLYVNAHTRWNNHHDTVGHFFFDNKRTGTEVSSETEVHGTENHSVKDIQNVNVD